MFNSMSDIKQGKWKAICAAIDKLYPEIRNVCRLLNMHVTQPLLQGQEKLQLCFTGLIPPSNDKLTINFIEEAIQTGKLAG